MKIKPIYLYIIIAVAAAAVLFIFTKDQRTNKETAEQVMPQDEIHKGLTEKMTTPPGKGNVSETVIQQMETMKKEIDKNPGDTAKIREYADFLNAAHKQDEAIKYYEKILSKDPKRTDVISSIAFIHYNRSEFQQAETLLNKILTIDKNHQQARYNLGAIAANQGDFAKARIIWKKLVSDYPDTEMGELARTSLEKL